VARARNFTKPAWALYRNSLLYLALLFAAMAVDGFVPVSPFTQSLEGVILQNPDLRLPPAP
jgi:hypothetical protein